ncbi:MAG: PH domain-containing protein [Clostridium sp.]|uniref:PH domain-containing protein n=1 Tax=Clostridium sp. TaxID=1506 RepID=UPI003F2FA721
MGFYDKITGKGTAGGADLSRLDDFLLPNESIIASYQFIRDSIVLTNLGVYMIDVQGVTGKKVETKFFPRKNIKSVSFETAGSFDLDVDIKIGVDGNTVVTANGIPYSAPIAFKVPKAQANEAKRIINQIKEHYLCI